MEASQNVRCMILPFGDHALMVPNVCVAEVIGFIAPESGNTFASCHLGDVSWRGLSVPVIAFETLLNLDEAAASGREQTAILYHPAGNTKAPYIGLRMSDIPKAYSAEKNSLMAQAEQYDSNEYCLFGFHYQDKQVFIPDYDKLFELLESAEVAK